MSPLKTKNYWGSLEELHESQEFLDSKGHEFAAPPEEQTLSEMERRDFLKVMGAGMLLATMACSRRPVEKIIPYVNKPEEVTPGVANWYASTCMECAAGCGVVVKTREGRPIKLEGNPDHPMNAGGLCARGQASLLNLYDPDRLKTPVQGFRGGKEPEPTSWETIDQETLLKLEQARLHGKKIALLTSTIISPSTNQLIQEFISKYHAQHVSFSAMAPEAIAQAQSLSYGKEVTPRYRLDQAKMIVTFGADFLGNFLSPVEFSKQFAKVRQLDSQFSRLVTFESALSLTGMNADTHVPLRAGEELTIALSLAHEIARRLNADQGIRRKLSSYAPDAVSKETGVDANLIKDLAGDLVSVKGQSLVLGGGPGNKNAVSLEVVVNLINSLLLNDGVTIDTSNAPSLQAVSSFEDLQNLVEDMRQGRVGVLVIHKLNPIYSLPLSLGFKEALKSVPFVVVTTDRVDETGVFSDYVCPDSHALESWGDANPQRGLYSIVQPTIAPMYDTRSFQESLLRWMGSQGTYYDYLKNFWAGYIFEASQGISDQNKWEDALRSGVVDRRGPDQARLARDFNPDSLRAPGSQADKDHFQLSLYPSIALGDGASANNPWLQELPDPMTKITWDNYVSIAPATARELRIQQGDELRLEGENFVIEIPAWIQPKLHEKTMMIALGYGHTHVGQVGNNVGVNVSEGQKIWENSLIWNGIRIDSVRKTGRRLRLATTQRHSSIEGRPIIKETTLKEFRENPASGNEASHELITMWQPHEYKGHRWGMAIDMNLCTGCNGCVVSCQSENNIPTVGKEQVLLGRELHWIRIDRYYSGEEDNPDVAHQPMLCQHCENAPCETVCPVLATVHNDEGLNTMIYNRCVGTRYCSNNCPYKVRRFNYYEYAKLFLKDPQHLALNPDISVREKGVMEKCTFCMQRIRDAKDRAKDQGRGVEDGDIKTACQQSCPTNAIEFGDLNDPKSRVSQMTHSERGYHVLEDLNVKPQITYMTKVRNQG